MANIFKSLMDAMKFSDDEDDEYNEYLKEFDDDEKEPEPAPVQRKALFERESSKSSIQELPSKKVNLQEEAVRKPRIISDKGKVVQLRNNKDMELKVVKPTSFSDCQDICDILLNGDAVIINLEGFETDLSQRVMDFVSGTVYAIKGQISPVSKLIYVVSPDNITISGDVMNLLTSGGVEAPTFSADF